MALFRKFFYKKPPDGLLEISERIYVFDCCFTTNIWDEEEEEYKAHIGGVARNLRDHSPEGAFMVFNFREEEVGDRSKQRRVGSILSDHDMTVMDYPRHYEGCPLLAMEMMHHFLRSGDSWLSLGPQNSLLFHCERGGWPVLAFMLAALLIYLNRFSSTPELKTLEMIYRQAPRELLQLMSTLNPVPSQLRYLQYVSRRNVGSEWPPLDRALTLDCVIIRLIPCFDGEGGCRPIFRIYGQDPFMASDRSTKVLFSTPKKSGLVRHYKQDDELVKIDIRCQVQGDVVLECINLDSELDREEMMFRVMFNTAFIRSNILMLNRDEVDMLWNTKEQYPKDFRAEILFSEIDSDTSFIPMDLPGFEDKEGLPMEAFAKVQEMFSNVDWLDQKSDEVLKMIQGKLEKSPSPQTSRTDKKAKPDLQVAVQRPTQSNIISQRLTQTSLSTPASYSNLNSLQVSPVSRSRYHSAPSALGIPALLEEEEVPQSLTPISIPYKTTPPKIIDTAEDKKVFSTPPPPPPPPPSFPGSSPASIAKTSLSAPPPQQPKDLSPVKSKNSFFTPPPPPPPPKTVGSAPPGPPPPPKILSSVDSKNSFSTPLPKTAGSAPPAPPPPPKTPLSIDSKNSFSTTPLKTVGSATPGPPPPPPPARNSPVPPPPAPPLVKGVSNGDIVPPVPTPPSLGGKGRGLQRTTSRPQAQPKKANLKPYHWLKLTRAMQGSLWAEAQKADESSKAPEFDMLEIESLFSAAAPSSDGQSSGATSHRRTSSSKPEIVHLIELRRAYNCEIMLSKVKVSLPDLVGSVLALDESALDVDQVENLIKFCPTKEEMELLKGYGGDKENLGKCEQFFLELMKVPRVESKLRVLAFKIQFHSQVSELRNNLNIVNSSSKEIRGSEKLKRIMQTILSLGNALNQGTARGSAIGFRLDSLLKLTDTRARNNKMTLMHYLCKVLSEKLPELLEFSKDLVNLEASSKIQFKYLAEEMQSVNKGLEKVIQELSASENDGPISDNFCKTLKAFLSHAEAEVRSLTSLYTHVGRNADVLALYFGEDPTRCTFEQAVSTLLNFVRMFSRAHEENCKQTESEKKKAKKLEAENEKIKLATTKNDSRHKISISIDTKF